MKIDKFGMFTAHLREDGEIDIKIDRFHFDAEGQPISVEDVLRAIGDDIVRRYEALAKPVVEVNDVIINVEKS